MCSNLSGSIIDGPRVTIRTLLAVVAFVLALGQPVSAADVNPRIIELQNALSELGIDPGPADGILGSKTVQAIKKYQAKKKLEVDGKFSGILLFGVQIDAGLARDKAGPEGQRKNALRDEWLALTDEQLMKSLGELGKKEFNSTINLISERVNGLPARWLLIKSGMAKTVVDATLSGSLQILFYPTGVVGIRQFQTDIGATKTGVLTVSEFSELTRRVTRQRDTAVSVSGFAGPKISTFRGFASVEGTWIIEGERIADPINTSKIRCLKARQECDLTQASVRIPKVEASDGTYFLSLFSRTYSVISWTKDEIRAQTSGKCRTTLLSLNLNSNEVFEVTSNNRNRECLRDPLTLPALDKPRIARLIPGFKVAQKFWSDRQKITGEYINPRFRKSFDSLENENGRP